MHPFAMLVRPFSHGADSAPISRGSPAEQSGQMTESAQLPLGPIHLHRGERIQTVFISLEVGGYKWTAESVYILLDGPIRST